ncbi:MAG: hypothetical protein CBB71_04415 [Rhodopirellula sp. TMED11]|nr:MAG: hypothetical protein CBB71_04415 [Rhodopirellula sp. TMED11]
MSAAATSSHDSPVESDNPNESSSDSYALAKHSPAKLDFIAGDKPAPIAPIITTGDHIRSELTANPQIPPRHRG